MPAVLSSPMMELCPVVSEERRTPCHKLNSAIAVISIDIGKNSFHIVGHDKRAAIMLPHKWAHTARQPNGHHRPPHGRRYYQHPIGFQPGPTRADCPARCSGRYTDAST